MAAHLVIPVVEASQVGEARRAAVRLAEGLGFDEVAAGRVAVVVTELGTNLAKHAREGRILLLATAHPSGAAGGVVEMLSLDQGPGMPDIDSCLRDGFSSAGTPGTGLGAIQRMADLFSVFTQPDHGTVIAARIAFGTRSERPSAGLDIGAISIAAPGEIACGDAWVFHAEAGRAMLMVVDGLGHGPTAAEAANEAVEVFEAHHDDTPSQLLERAHVRLRTTRGAAAAVAELDIEAKKIVFSGAGNIAGRIISGIEDRSLLSQHGTVGFQIRRLQDISYDWSEHALLVLHSDGIVSRWTLGGAAAGLLQCEPIVIAGWLIREHFRGRDDATVAVVRRPRA